MIDYLFGPECFCNCPYDNVTQRKIYTGDWCENENSCATADLGAHNMLCLNGGSP